MTLIRLRYLCESCRQEKTDEEVVEVFAVIDGVPEYKVLCIGDCLDSYVTEIKNRKTP